jgi:hypothetical protein
MTFDDRGTRRTTPATDSAIAALLARGLLRWHQTRKIQPDLAEKQEVSDSPDSSPNRLDLSGDTSVHGPVGSTDPRFRDLNEGDTRCY